MKKLVVLMLVLVLGLTCVLSSGCGEKKTVTVGYTIVDGLNYENEDGELVGFDTELAKKVFGDLGYEVRFKLIEWDNKYVELDGKTIDVIWNGFTANCADKDGIQRSAKVDFSYNYMVNAQAIVRKSTAADITDLTQFDGTSVTYESGSAADSLIAGIDGANINKKPVTSQVDAIKSVNLGTAQYAVVDILLARSMIEQAAYSSLVLNQGIELPIEYYAIGFRKGSELTALVNSKLVEYAENGYLAQLATKYNFTNQAITDFSDQIK